MEEAFDELAIVGHGLPRAHELDRVVKRLQPVIAKIIRPMWSEAVAIESRIGEGNPSNRAWRELDSLAKRIEPVVAETLLLIEGALARAAGIDAGLCAIVDRLLDDVARLTVPWERTAIPASREETRSRTWVIGVRISDTTIWSLPLMVHEFGHYAVERLEDHHNQRPGARLVSGGWTEDLVDDAQRLRASQLFSYAQANELFADIFATYVLGPAYVAAHVWRGVPHRAWAARGDHPAWGHRLAASLHALRALAPWDWAAGLIGPLWDRDLEAAGEALAAPSGARELIEAFVGRALDLMGTTAPMARFADEDAVLAAEEALVHGEVPADQLDVRTVINAAWIGRLRRGWNDADQLGETALEWYRRAVDMRPMGTSL